MSDRITFANTLLKTDDGTYRAGDVIRNSTGRDDPWSQCIILGFSRPDKYNDVYVRLARPYAYASCVGTTTPGVLTGVEEFEIPASKLRYETVLTTGDNGPRISGSIGHGRIGQYDSECIDLRTEVDDCACPGCGCKPGEGRTSGCTHPDGCGYRG